MKTTHKQGYWRRWLSLGRIIPLLTVFVAGLMGIAALIGWIQASFVEGIILAMLALLATDALTERINVLEQIDASLQRISGTSSLHPRSELPTVEECGRGSAEIVITGSGLTTVIVRNTKFFEEKLDAGCTLRFMLLDPASPALATFEKMNKTADFSSEIKASISRLEALQRIAMDTNGSCEVRLSQVFLPFSSAAFDPDKRHGLMTVELVTYMLSPDERPNLQLSRAHDLVWFELFQTQYDKLWQDSKPHRLSQRT